jgi:acetylxylan esterase
MDNAVCGGPDSGSGITSTTPPISSAALNQIKAVILMGNPRYVAGLSYDVGTCTAQGVSFPQPFFPSFPTHKTRS